LEGVYGGRWVGVFVSGVGEGVLFCEPEALVLVPRLVALEFLVMPARVSGGVLSLFMVDAGNLRKVNDLERLLGVSILPVAASEAAIREAFARYFPVEAVGLRIEAPPVVAVVERGGERDDVVENDNAVVHNVNTLILRALSSRVSDVHFEQREGDFVIRFRVDGLLATHATMPAWMGRSVIARLKIMGGMDIAERRLPQDGRISFRHAGVSADLRVSTSPTVFGERAVLRVLQKAENLLPIEGLDFSERNLGLFLDLVHKPYGMILVTGPTGSGKSFTLFSVLKRLNVPSVNVLTVEDPVEYELPGISQSQVNAKAGFSFPNALRAFLRQDPDVIMVGEVRDGETARVSVDAALTGHLVLATLHTNDAPSAPGRLVKMGIEPYAVSGSLLGVLAQRLVRRVCVSCRVQRPLNPVMVRLLNAAVGEGELGWVGLGCVECGGTGFRGRVAIQELMVVTPELQEVLAERSDAVTLREIALRSGMRSLREDGVSKALLGLTTLEEVHRGTLE
jgi:type IV pilus assembly protein PilB